MEISSDFCMFILDKMEIWSKIEEILTPRADFRQISAGLFSIKWKFLKILANNRQNGIPFHRECTVQGENEEAGVVAPPDTRQYLQARGAQTPTYNYYPTYVRWRAASKKMIFWSKKSSKKSKKMVQFSDPVLDQYQC